MRVETKTIDVVGSIAGIDIHLPSDSWGLLDVLWVRAIDYSGRVEARIVIGTHARSVGFRRIRIAFAGEGVELEFTTEMVTYVKSLYISAPEAIRDTRKPWDIDAPVSGYLTHVYEVRGQGS